MYGCRIVPPGYCTHMNMQKMMKRFHIAMKILKYLRLCRNSRIRSPIVSCCSLSSSNESGLRFFLRNMHDII